MPVFSRTVLFLLLFSVHYLAGAETRVSELRDIYHSIKNKQLALLQDQPINIVSKINDSRLSADVFAIQTIKLSELIVNLSSPAQWCRFITLHLNIKACVYYLKPNTSLSFYAGRKFYEPAENAFELKYQFDIEEKTDHFFKLKLSAKEGPFGTSDYLILLEAIKLNDEVLIHMSLSYESSFSSRLGTTVYLSTIGSDKVGFSQQKMPDGSVQYIQGVEGIIERNVMRYYLALSTFFEYKQQQEMINAWFDATEVYATQLREVERADYIEAKKQEYNQQNQMQKRVDSGLDAFDSFPDGE